MKRYLSAGLFAAAMASVTLLTPIPGQSQPPGQNQAPGQSKPTGSAMRAEMPLDDAAVIARVEATLDRALAYLADRQNRDGSWRCGYGINNAVNGLAILAFLGRGHLPRQGPYGATLDRGKDYILATQRADGLFQSPNPSNGSMYEQGLSTLAMVELHGMVADPRLDDAVRRAVGLIIRAQSPPGGWRYQPDSKDADISVTVMQLVALRAAQNAGLAVPQPTLDRAVAYVLKCQAKDGGFGYQPGNGSGPARTAAGILSLQLAGKQDSQEIGRALDYLNKQRVEWNGEFFYYFHYYAIQAQYQAGGATWNSWHPVVREMLIKEQNENGSWDIPPGDGHENRANEGDKIYATAMSCLVLEVYLHYLPAYQR